MTAVESATCAACGSPFTPRRSTARFCGDRCRKVAQRSRDRGSSSEGPPRARGGALRAKISVTGYSGADQHQNRPDVTLTAPRASKPLPKGIVRDAKYPNMYRLALPDGTLSDMLNLTRAKDALAAVSEASAA